MELFSFDYAGKHFALLGSNFTGSEQLLVDGQQVSSVRSFSTSSSHEFELADMGAMRLDFNIDYVRGQVDYWLYQGQQVVLRAGAPIVQAQSNSPPNESRVVATVSPSGASAPTVGSKGLGGHMVAMLGIGFKLLKSANVVKVVLAGTALAGWSILFSWQFAVVLIGVIVFHEYGHLRAMKKCGMKTKGIYLIPFVGGVAVGERAESCWDEVYISMMGPVFGLFMTAAFYVLFLVTGSHFAGLVASVSALVNLFNLLPVYPLDGGHVVKSLVLSGQRHWGFTLLLVLSATCFALALKFGLTFLSFFIVIGALDLLASRREFAAHPQAPLNRYGIWYCVVWYFAVVGIFIAIILAMAASGAPGTEIATAVLKS